jgi:hypothetical protein
MGKHRHTKHRLPLSLPIRFGLADGSNAHLLVDAKGTIFGTLFGIMPHLGVADATKNPRSIRGIRTAEYIVHAVNAHDAQSLALRKIAATSPSKRIAALALAALESAGEL